MADCVFVYLSGSDCASCDPNRLSLCFVERRLACLGPLGIFKLVGAEGNAKLVRGDSHKDEEMDREVGSRGKMDENAPGFLQRSL